MAVHPETVELTSSVPAADDSSKKVRKPYTITKSRESWTDQEHDKFLEALQLFDRDWKKIEAFVGSKTVIQIRSHAQKYFLKVQKNGTGEHVPPPRPKRKASQPYPQKAPKTAGVRQSDPVYAAAVPPSPAAPTRSYAATMPAWIHHMTPPGNLAHMKKGESNTGVESVDMKNQIVKNGDTSSRSLPQLLPVGQKDGVIVLRAMPDFAEVYSFLGSVFDPAMDGHLERMHEMTPIDRETVLLLMRNLSINLSSGDFEEHKLFLSVYDMDAEDALPPSNCDMGSDAQPALVNTNDDGLVSGIVAVGVESEACERAVLSQCCANELGNIPLNCDSDKEKFSNDADDATSNGLLIQEKSFLEQCLLGASTPDCHATGSEDESGPPDSSDRDII